MYHAHGYPADATFEVIPTELPLGSSHAVAAGAWWAVEHASRGATNTAFVAWAAQRAASMGVDGQAVTSLLTEPLHAEVEAPHAGTALPLGAPLFQITGPIAQLVLRMDRFQTVLSLGFGSATRAAALCKAADGCSVIDDASIHHPDPETSSFLAWCGRVGGFSGTTHTTAGWQWELPVVGVPSEHSKLCNLGDAMIPADDLHAAVAGLVRRTTKSSVVLKRVCLDHEVTDETDLDRLQQLRRALNRYGHRRVRICARVAPTPEAVATVTKSAAPVDILILSSPWWGAASTACVPLTLPGELPAEARNPASRGPRQRRQLHRDGNQISLQPWGSTGLLHPLYSPRLPLPVVPVLLSRRSPLRASVHAEMLVPPDSSKVTGR